MGGWSIISLSLPSQGVSEGTERELYGLLLEAWMQSLSMTVGEVCDKCIFTADSAQIKFHHPFTLSDLVILKCCANTACCQQAAPPPFSQWGETHCIHWSLHSPKNAHFSTVARSIHRCRFHECSTRAVREQGWMGLDQRAPKEISGEHDGTEMGWNASLAGQQSSQHLGPFFQNLCQGHRVGSCSTGGRRLLCLQLMVVVPDVRAPWGSTSWAMTAESPLWPQVCQSNYRRLFCIICGSDPTYLTGSKILSLCTASNKSD